MTSRRNKLRIARIVAALALVLALCIVFNGCIKKPLFVNINAINIGLLKDSNIAMQIDFKIYNPNYIKLTLQTARITMYCKGMLVGEGAINNEVPLPMRDTGVIPLASTINLKSLSLVFPAILAADSCVFSVEGDSKVKVFGQGWNIPIKEKIKLNVKQLIIGQVDKMFKSGANFAITGIKLKSLPAVNRTEFAMQVMVQNGLPFGYRLQGLDLNVYRTGGTAQIAHWTLADTIYQHAGAVANIPLTVEVDNLNILKQARLSDILHPSLSITLKGEATVAVEGLVFTIPVEQTRNVGLNLLDNFNF